MANAVDMRQVRPHPKTNIHMLENGAVLLDACKNVGLQVHNIGPEDIVNGVPHLLLGLIWQIIKLGLVSKVKANHLTRTGISSTDAAANEVLTTPDSHEAILLSWVNDHLRAAGCPRKIENFSSDLADCECYAYLIARVGAAFRDWDGKSDTGMITEEGSGTNGHGDGEEATQNKPASPLDPQDILREPDMAVRAERVLSEAGRLGCRHFLSPSDILTGNRHLNIAFLAVLYGAQTAWPSASSNTGKELKRTETELKRVRAASVGQGEELARVKAELQAALRRENALIAETEKLKSTVRDVSVDRPVSSSSADAGVGGMSGDKTEGSGREAYVKEMEEEIAALREELRRKDASTAREKLEEEIMTLKKAVQMQAKQREGSPGQESSEEQIASLKDALTLSKRQVARLKEVLEVAAQRKSDTITKMAVLDAAAGASGAISAGRELATPASTQRITALESELAAAKSEIESLQSSRSPLITENASLNEALSTALQRIRTLRDENALLENQVRSLSTETRSLQAELDALLDELREQSIQFQEKLGEAAETLENLERERIKLMGDVERVTVEKNRLKDAVETARRTEEEAKEDLERVTRELKRGEIEREGLERERAMLKSRCLEMEREVENCVHLLAAQASNWVGDPTSEDDQPAEALQASPPSIGIRTVLDRMTSMMLTLQLAKDKIGRLEATVAAMKGANAAAAAGKRLARSRSASAGPEDQAGGPNSLLLEKIGRVNSEIKELRSKMVSRSSVASIEGIPESWSPRSGSPSLR
ncbi:hypothetical protein HK104_005337 [Borealophlyctis nickersoniae]|nr:hypothetical protein HK104_005337 [Borealophlyctis nickersoniae]